jgi:hypothetical protein
LQKGQYKEGVVISDQLSTLFRSVSMPLALALAMTEQSEKGKKTISSIFILSLSYKFLKPLINLLRRKLMSLLCQKKCLDN